MDASDLQTAGRSRDASALLRGSGLFAAREVQILVLCPRLAEFDMQAVICETPSLLTRSPAQSCHAGFGFTDCFELFNPDRLHGGPKGILERIVGYIIDALKLQDAAFGIVNTLLQSAPSYPGTQVPAEGLDWRKATAVEMACIGRLLLVPLLGAPSSESGTLDDLMDLLTCESFQQDRLPFLDKRGQRMISCGFVQCIWSGRPCVTWPCTPTSR